MFGFLHAQASPVRSAYVVHVCMCMNSRLMFSCAVCIRACFHPAARVQRILRSSCSYHGVGERHLLGIEWLSPNGKCVKGSGRHTRTHAHTYAYTETHTRLNHPQCLIFVTLTDCLTTELRGRSHHCWTRNCHALRWNLEVTSNRIGRIFNLPFLHLYCGNVPSAFAW
jgi:hypothetical protein